MNRDKGKTTEELRHRAERRLQKNKQQRATPPATQAELQRLVHELEVHQVELELQNEELQQARLELEKYLAQYTDLYDFAPVAYFTLDPDGLIRQVNLTGVQMIGVERSRLVSQYFGHFVTADSRSKFATFLEKTFQSRVQETIELEMQKQRNEKGNEEARGKLFVHVEARVSEGGQECRIAMVDITAQKQAEDALRESEQKYRTLFETMSQGVVYQDSEGKIISANPAAENILGLSLDQMQGKAWKDLRWRTINEDGTEFPDESHPSMVALHTGKAVNNVVMGVISLKGDRHVWLNINAIPQFLPGASKPFQVFITFENITERKRMVIYNKLTDREKEVFNLLVKGRSRKIIAETLNISPKTVDKHRENLMEKLSLQTFEEAVQFARLIGLVDPVN